MNHPRLVTPPDMPAPGGPLARTRERVVQRLSLLGEGSSAHTVAPYRDGLRVTLSRPAPLAPLYAYALPWARGWTVFTSDRTDVTNQSWHRNCGYSLRVSNPRDLVGPENVNIKALTDAFIDAIDHLEFHFSPHPDDVIVIIEDEIEDDDYFDGDDGGPGDVVFYGHP